MNPAAAELYDTFLGGDQIDRGCGNNDFALDLVPASSDWAFTSLYIPFWRKMFTQFSFK